MPPSPTSAPTRAIEQAPRAPVEIVAGIYLRALREAADGMLDQAASVARASISAVSRWERAESPIPGPALEVLLTHWGADPEEARYLRRHLPASRGLHIARNSRDHGQPDDRVPPDPWDVVHRGPWDKWVDVGVEAVARYAALTRVASQAVYFTTQRIPPGLRTAEYRAALAHWAPDPDEPAVKPRWLAELRRTASQRRTLLLDDSVLHRPSAAPDITAGQLRHLLGLADVGALTLRVLPRSAKTSALHLVGEVAAFTVHDRHLYAGAAEAPWYENRSAHARALQAGLDQALADAASHVESCALIQEAAYWWSRRPGS